MTEPLAGDSIFLAIGEAGDLAAPVTGSPFFDLMAGAFSFDGLVTGPFLATFWMDVSLAGADFGVSFAGGASLDLGEPATDLAIGFPTALVGIRFGLAKAFPLGVDFGAGFLVEAFSDLTALVFFLGAAAAVFPLAAIGLVVFFTEVDEGPFFALARGIFLAFVGFFEFIKM